MRACRAFLIAVLAFALPAPAVAQRDEGPEWEALAGVWRGTVGRQAVTVCFNGYGSGSYYYDRYLRPIGLRGDEDELVERINWDDNGSARWSIPRVSGDKATAEWSDGKRHLPIRLTRVAGTPADDTLTGNCGTAAFIQAPVDSGHLAETAQTIGGMSITRIDYVPGKAFDPDDLIISSFAYPASQPGDAAINATLRQDLDDVLNKDVPDCIGMSLEGTGVSGDFQSVSTPSMVAPRWLAVQVDNSVYCGGAHPSYWQDMRVFDRKSGEEIDPSRFLDDRFMTFYDPGEGVELSDRPIEMLDDALYQRISAHWPEDNRECLAEQSNFLGWSIGLARDGLIFQPRVNHAQAPCAEMVTVPWAELAPFLSPLGVEARGSLGSSSPR